MEGFVSDLFYVEFWYSADSSIERPMFFLSIKWIRYVQNVPCTNHFNYEIATFSWSFHVDSASLGQNGTSCTMGRNILEEEWGQKRTLAVKKVTKGERSMSWWTEVNREMKCTTGSP